MTIPFTYCVNRYFYPNPTAVGSFLVPASLGVQSSRSSPIEPIAKSSGNIPHEAGAAYHRFLLSILVATPVIAAEIYVRRYVAGQAAVRPECPESRFSLTSHDFLMSS